MASQRRQSPLDAVAIKYLSLVKNFLQKENPRKLVQFSRVQRLLIMKAITPEQWTKLVSELFSRNPSQTLNKGQLAICILQLSTLFQLFLGTLRIWLEVR